MFFTFLDFLDVELKKKKKHRVRYDTYCFPRCLVNILFRNINVINYLNQKQIRCSEIRSNPFRFVANPIERHTAGIGNL